MPSGQVAALGRRGSRLVATADLRADTPLWVDVSEPVHALAGEPLVVAGWLPAGVADVQVLWPGDWISVQIRGRGWLGVAEAAAASGKPPIWALAFRLDDGSFEPVPDPEEAQDSVIELKLELGEPTEQALSYAAALADAVADDVAADALPGPLRRIVVRWFWDGDPEYLTIHALATGDPQPDVEDSWYPLEWDLGEREMERTDRVRADPAVRRAAAALVATFARSDDGDVDDLAHVPAVFEAIRRLPGALAARGVPVTDRFAVAAAHFEGWGLLQSLRATASSDLLAALEAHDELPTE